MDAARFYYHALLTRKRRRSFWRENASCSQNRMSVQIKLSQAPFVYYRFKWLLMIGCDSVISVMCVCWALSIVDSVSLSFLAGQLPRRRCFSRLLISDQSVLLLVVTIRADVGHAFLPSLESLLPSKTALPALTKY